MALELGRRGAKVIVNYANSTQSAEEVVQAIKKGGSDAVAIKANVSDVDQIVQLFDQAVKVWGKLNIVCSNSGVVSFGHVKDVTPEEFDRVFTVNTRGQFFVAREAHKHLEVGGRLILMGSITGQAKGVPKHAVYSGSKGAIETFVRCMAVDFGDKKITVNAIAPGGIKTDMYQAVCREYIPGGDKLSDQDVDEVSLLLLQSIIHLLYVLRDGLIQLGSTPPRGRLSAVLAFPSISPVLSASWLPKTASG
ncbi:naphthalenetriol reductase [Daldinia loculata]|nr:naphthalenetriol reductase [Daldinia loculata]